MSALTDALVEELEQIRKFFGTTTAVFDVADAGFAPTPEMYTVAGQIAHVGLTLDWFLAGAFGPGWHMDFEADIARAKAITTLDAARATVADGFARAIRTISDSSDADLQAPIPDDVIMNGAPRKAIVAAIVDHCAHHRGSLAVYARLLGKVPPMPYS